MDREEGMKLLRGGTEGVAEWNRFVRQGGEIPNLDGVDLHKAELIGVNFSEANLNGANFNEANLRAAILTQANCREANLIGADLYSAAAIATDFRGANFSRTILSGVNLYRADLSKAQCWSTIFSDLDLSDTGGLETVIHDGPSTLGTDTLFHSRGKIPEAFLRGCGVPDVLIANLPSLLGAIQPIQFYTCFLSHSSADKEFARRLHGRMTEAGLRVWFDEKDMQSGKKLHEQIDEAIRLHEKLLIVLSPDSIVSNWVKTEIRKAFKLGREERKLKLFPLNLVSHAALLKWEWIDADTGIDLAAEIREFFIPDFSNWKDHDAFEAAFSNLLRDLKAEIPPKAE